MIPFVRDFDFEYGRADQVSPLIRRVVANNPGPFTFTGTGTYIVGHGEVAVIDPGPAIAEHLEAILAAVEGETVTAILVTHNHADHSPLARPLAERTGATTYGCPWALEVSVEEAKVEDDPDPGFIPQVDVCAGGRIAGRGWTFEAIPTPGHTSNHVCYALVEENALFCGDHIMGWSTTVIVPPDGDMQAYYESLKTIRERSFSTLWPTHGPPVTKPGAFIDAYLAHRLAREDQILAELSKGPARIKDMVEVIYAAVDPRLHPAAARSVHAHLIRLARIGKVVSLDGEARADSLYRLP